MPVPTHLKVLDVEVDLVDCAGAVVWVDCAEAAVVLVDSVAVVVLDWAGVVSVAD